MTITRRPLVAAALLTGGLLLLAAASCSLERKSRAKTTGSNGNETTGAVKTGGEYKPTGSFVANPFCRVCHLDFDEEKLAAKHESAGIGCERCHGESLRHRSDEANVTPPEIMYPKERINPTCMMCHPRHEIRQVKEHQPILEAAASIFETAPSTGDGHRYCTDCHGRHHRMRTRSVRWDKCTGELIR